MQFLDPLYASPRILIEENSGKACGPSLLTGTRLWRTLAHILRNVGLGQKYSESFSFPAALAVLPGRCLHPVSLSVAAGISKVRITHGVSLSGCQSPASPR